MKVSVKLFATYREHLPPGSVGGGFQVEVLPGTTAADLLETYNIPVDASSVILVNGLTPEPGQALVEGDVVSAFPAMAGG